MKGLNTLTGVYSLVISAIFLVAPLLTIGQAMNSQSKASDIDMIFRVTGVIMIILGSILLAKAKGSSTAGKILIILAGGIVIMFSSLLGFVSGILGIVGGVLILSSTKNIGIEKDVWQ